jgi:hypothetical protein
LASTPNAASTAVDEAERGQCLSEALHDQAAALGYQKPSNLKKDRALDPLRP